MSGVRPGVVGGALAAAAVGAEAVEVGRVKGMMGTPVLASA